jgi:hypothetical protein
MAQIEVTHIEDETYRVTVTEDHSSSSHDVTVQSADLDHFGRGASAEDLIAGSFRFLLDREPKESILSRFDLTVIGRYFPEYPDRIGDYL